MKYTGPDREQLSVFQPEEQGSVGPVAALSSQYKTPGRRSTRPTPSLARSKPCKPISLSATMQVFAVLLLAVAAVSANVQLPIGSTVVKNDRAGGNFAYSVEQTNGYVASPFAYAAAPVAYTAGFVKPFEFVKPEEVKNVEYKPLTYAAQYIKPFEYKPIVYSAEKPLTYTPYLTSEVKPVDYTKPVVDYTKPAMDNIKPGYEKAQIFAAGYYGAPAATYAAYPYNNAYPYAYTYPYSYYPYTTYPYGVIKAEK